MKRDLCSPRQQKGTFKSASDANSLDKLVSVFTSVFPWKMSVCFYKWSTSCFCTWESTNPNTGIVSFANFFFFIWSFCLILNKRL